MSFANERNVKAVRKEHVCDGCNRKIEIGQPATRWSGVVDGDFSIAIYHPDCRQAEVAMNDLLGWQHLDDWYPLHEADANERDALRERFPAAIARLESRAALAQEQSHER